MLTTLKRIVSALVVTAAIADLAIGAAQAQSPVRGGTLTMIMQPEPPILVSAFNTALPIGVVSTKMMEGLVAYDLDMKMRPLLAESWEHSPDGLTYRFNLRKGVKWHDGKDFTAADVEFTLNKVWKTLHARGRATFAGVTAVETPDPHTVILRLKAPSPSLWGALSSYESQVLPKHVYDGGDVVRNPANTAPIGTGPFMFKEWQKGNFLILERNPNYWDAGKPHLDRIIMRVYTDAGARSAALETGEAQLAGVTPVPFSEAQRLTKLPHIALETRGFEYFAPMFFMEFNLRRPPLDNKLVRHAIAHAIDRNALIQTAWFGFGKIATSPLPSTMAQFHAANLPQYPFDPRKAEALLDQAGLKRGADGKRFKITHDFSPLGGDYQRSAEFVKQQLARVGIEVEVRSQDVPGYIKRVYTDRDFDLTNTFFTMTFDPTQGVQRLYWSKNIQVGVPFSNASGYANPEMDRILEAAAVENDPAKRRALFADMQRIAQEDLPIFPVFEQQFFTLYNKKVMNHTRHADGIFNSFADVYLAP